MSVGIWGRVMLMSKELRKRKKIAVLSKVPSQKVGPIRKIMFASVYS